MRQRYELEPAPARDQIIGELLLRVGDAGWFLVRFMLAYTVVCVAVVQQGVFTVAQCESALTLILMVFSAMLGLTSLANLTVDVLEELRGRCEH